MVSAHLLRVFKFAKAVRERVHFRTQRFCEENCVVAEPTNTDDTDLLPRTGAIRLQRREHSETGAEHRSCVFRLNSVRNLKDEAFMRADGSRVTALSYNAVGIHIVLRCVRSLSAAKLTTRKHTHIGINQLEAIVLVSGLASSALHAAPDLGTDTDSVADLKLGHLRADPSHISNNFMSHNERKPRVTPTLG